MFSVNNFYDFVVAEYDFKKTQNFVMTFCRHGSKDLHELHGFGVDPSTIENFNHLFSTSPKIIMHDQEPVSLKYLDTYKDRMMSEQKKVDHLKNSDKVSDRRYHMLSNFQNGTLIDFIKFAINPKKNNFKNIVCHSEKNSLDIKILRDNNFVDCYYWWHGMISRDWFRHWQHYSDLMPTDKSQCWHRFLLYSRDHTGTREYRSTVVNHLKQYQKIVRYNWNDVQVDSSYSAKIDINDATNSAIHLVAETLFDTEKIYLTEKVFKPMVMSQPFILFAPPGSLQYLRDYGFQTFESCWDESYDLETDSEKRMCMILSLIDSLAFKNDCEFRGLYQKCLPIVQHNRKRFYSQEFQDQCILEFHTNMKAALSIQLDYDLSSSSGNSSASSTGSAGS
jgi:hypothetical protein